MNITQLLAGLIIINIMFSLTTTYTSGDLQSLINDTGELIGENNDTTRDNLTGDTEDSGQGFFMQEPSDSSQNWLESMLRFGVIFGYFIVMLAGATLFVNADLLLSGNIIVQFATFLILLGVFLINFMMIRGIYELLRKG